MMYDREKLSRENIGMPVSYSLAVEVGGGWGRQKSFTDKEMFKKHDDGGEAQVIRKLFPAGRGQVPKLWGRNTWICLQKYGRESKQLSRGGKGLGERGRRGPSHR